MYLGHKKNRYFVRIEPPGTAHSVAERKRHIVYVRLLQEEKGKKEQEKEEEALST